jgi:hypothetical protein
MMNGYCDISAGETSQQGYLYQQGAEKYLKSIELLIFSSYAVIWGSASDD